MSNFDDNKKIKTYSNSVIIKRLLSYIKPYRRNFIFAIILTFIISKLINTSLVNEYNLMFTLLSPGIRQVLLVLAVSVGVAFISTFIPVYNIAMKRPIDAIRDR